MKGKVDRKRIIGFTKVDAKEEELMARGFKKVDSENRAFYYKWIKEGTDEAWYLNYRDLNGEGEPILYCGIYKERER